MKMRFVVVTLTLVALCLASAATSALALEKFEFTDTKSFTVGSSPELDLESIAGNLTYEVVDGTEATVEIVVHVRADDEKEELEIRDEVEVKVDGSNGELEATVDRPKDFSKRLRKKYGKNRSISVSFHVTGPQGAYGYLSTISGDTRVSGIAGPVDLSTVSGNAEALDVTKRVKAHTVSGDAALANCGEMIVVNTVSGDIRVDDAGADVRAGSVSGRIDIEGAGGDVESSSVSGRVSLSDIAGEVSATTTSGDIRVAHKSGDLDAETVSGDIVARSTSTEGSVIMYTTSGSIELYTDPDHVGEVLLSSFSGEIHLDTDVKVRKQSRRGLKGTMGDGDVTVEVVTHSGDIVLGEL